jgi:hypothetical protein
MRPTILLSASHSEQTSGPIDGFRFLWAYYVSGYRPEKHCQPGLRGRRVAEFCSTTATVGGVIALDCMDRFPYVYVCGVSRGPKVELREKNLHFPLEYAAGELAEIETYNGYRFRAENARQLPIPEFTGPRDGKSEEHVRCKNFRFAAAYFGYPPAASDRRTPG